MKSLNKVMLIGNATKNPELRYTPQGTAVCSFNIATNREWKDSTGQPKSEATFHNIIVWNKLAEITAQYVTKGSKIYMEGRISNRSWKDQQGINHNITEVVADGLILLDNKTVQKIPLIPEESPPEPKEVRSEEIENTEKLDLDDIQID